jgi:CspA family cold shock protein
MIGVVKSFSDAGGFGFIDGADGAEVFVHYSVVQMTGFRTLLPGQEVEYDLVIADKGPAARNVRLLTPSSSSASSGK